MGRKSRNSVVYFSLMLIWKLDQLLRPVEIRLLYCPDINVKFRDAQFRIWLELVCWGRYHKSVTQLSCLKCASMLVTKIFVLNWYVCNVKNIIGKCIWNHFCLFYVITLYCTKDKKKLWIPGLLQCQSQNFSIQNTRNADISKYFNKFS